MVSRNPHLAESYFKTATYYFNAKIQIRQVFENFFRRGHSPENADSKDTFCFPVRGVDLQL